MLLELFALKSATFMNDGRSVALVRRKLCCSASTGLFIIANAIHLPPSPRTIGPRWVIQAGEAARGEPAVGGPVADGDRPHAQRPAGPCRTNSNSRLPRRSTF